MERAPPRQANTLILAIIVLLAGACADRPEICRQADADAWTACLQAQHSHVRLYMPTHLQFDRYKD
jgi:hypothetical protein